MIYLITLLINLDVKLKTKNYKNGIYAQSVERIILKNTNTTGVVRIATAT